MKQLMQSYRNGTMEIIEVPIPACGKKGILVNTSVSLVSPGTEKMVMEMARKSMVGKALARPDLVKQFLDKVQKEGLVSAFDKASSKLDTPVPLGYSCAGTVMEVGAEAGSGISRGDRVACAGAGFASHSQVNYIPRNLFAGIPDEVSDEEASFATLGAIALQGVRQLAPAVGENVAVIGLGLIGQLTVQILKASGCRVIGTDVSGDKLAHARKSGADKVCLSGDLVKTAEHFSGGRGVDGVIITASTSSNQPVVDAAEILRFKGRVVIVGMVGMDIPRNLYYKKELDVRFSMSYGPGRYDPVYEEKGVDYPFGYVRWTEQRNLEAFLNLVREGKVRPGELITHRFDFKDVMKAYDLLEGRTKESYLGILIRYAGEKPDAARIVRFAVTDAPAERVRLGFIGAGAFARSVIIPALKKLRGCEFAGLCTATGISAHQTARKHGFDYITTDPAQIFDDRNINAVIIATRHDTHFEYVTRGLKSGKAVFVEKPLCIKEEELSALENMYRSSAALPVLAVGFNRRFSPAVRKIKDALGVHAPAAITYRVNAGLIPADNWIQDRETGGGRIIGEVCHFVDTCMFLAGALPVSVFAQPVKAGRRDIPEEDNVNILITFANGSTAAINYFAYGNRNMPKEYIEVFSDNFAARLDNFSGLSVFRGNRKQRFKYAGQDKGHGEELKSFIHAVESGPPPVPPEELFSSTRVTFKILESLRHNTVVRV